MTTPEMARQIHGNSSSSYASDSSPEGFSLVSFRERTYAAFGKGSSSQSSLRGAMLAPRRVTVLVQVKPVESMCNSVPWHES